MKSTLYIVIFLTIQIQVYSQNWTNYNETNSGLADNGVSCITVDNNDNIWVGTTNGCVFPIGLNRFDGTSWSLFTPGNSGLVSGSVQRVIADHNNNIWISYGFCSNGITFFDGNSWITYDTTNSNIPSEDVYDLFIDSNNDLWIASGGITKFDGTNFINYFSNPPSGDIIELYVKDSIVFATSENLGLYKFNINDNSFTHYTTQNSNIPSMNFGSLEMDQNGLLWMGCQYAFPGSIGGIATFDGNNFTAINPFNSTGTWVYYNQSIAVDQNNNIWVSNRCEGLYKFDGTTWTQIPNLPLTGCAGFVYSDPFNRIWYGDVYSGIWTNNPNVGLDNPIVTESSIVFPNPTSQQIVVQQKSGGQGQFVLKNIFGHVILKENIQHFDETNRFDLDIPSGIYFWNIINKENIFHSGKLTIIK